MFPVLFLSVQGHGVCILLIHNPGHHRCGCITVWYQCFRHVGFHKLNRFGHSRCLGADRTLCCFHINIYNLTLCRSETEFSSYEFPANYFHFSTTISTMLLIFGKWYDFITGWNTFEDIRLLAFCFPCVCFHGNRPSSL